MAEFASRFKFRYLGPRIFLDFSPHEKAVRVLAAKRSTRVAKRRERKTSGHLRLESHFHEEARVRIRILGLGLVDIFTRTQTSTSCLIGNTDGTVGYLLLHFLRHILPIFIGERICLHIKYFMSSFYTFKFSLCSKWTICLR